MRGRKRHRKRDEKRRGVYGLPVRVTAKRRREQPTADALAKAISYDLAKDPEAFYARLVATHLQMLTPRIPRVAEFVKVPLR